MKWQSLCKQSIYGQCHLAVLHKLSVEYDILYSDLTLVNVYSLLYEIKKTHAISDIWWASIRHWIRNGTATFRSIYEYSLSLRYIWRVCYYDELNIRNPFLCVTMREIFSTLYRCAKMCGTWRVNTVHSHRVDYSAIISDNSSIEQLDTTLTPITTIAKWEHNTERHTVVDAI